MGPNQYFYIGWLMSVVVVYTSMYVHGTAYMWRWKYSLQEPVLLPPCEFQGQVHAIGLGCHHLNPVRCIAVVIIINFNYSDPLLEDCLEWATDLPSKLQLCFSERKKCKCSLNCGVKTWRINWIIWCLLII